MDSEWTGKQIRRSTRKSLRHEDSCNLERRCIQTVLEIQELGNEAFCFVVTGMDFTEIWGHTLIPRENVGAECAMSLHFSSGIHEEGRTRWPGWDQSPRND